MRSLPGEREVSEVQHRQGPTPDDAPLVLGASHSPISDLNTNMESDLANRFD
jgi:hypothetical protein